MEPFPVSPLPHRYVDTHVYWEIKAIRLLEKFNIKLTFIYMQIHTHVKSCFPPAWGAERLRHLLKAHSSIHPTGFVCVCVSTASMLT